MTGVRAQAPAYDGAFTDQPGDPHSPYRYGTGPGGQLRGLAHAHLGWPFSSEPTSAGSR
ncbi:hypothetical protein [Nonomuraea sp. B5E05]|uniref:hypothetical protein n=1 Tax=Nonomuraea sp. B5E05 TaxID=3153569 RepID=UPI0032615C0A